MTEPRIVLFDGVCNLCVGSVQFIIRHDRERVFRFASLQSEVGRALSHQHDIVAEKLETMVPRRRRRRVYAERRGHSNRV